MEGHQVISTQVWMSKQILVILMVSNIVSWPICNWCHTYRVPAVCVYVLYHLDVNHKMLCKRKLVSSCPFSWYGGRKKMRRGKMTEQLARSHVFGTRTEPLFPGQVTYFLVHLSCCALNELPTQALWQTGLDDSLNTFWVFKIKIWVSPHRTP